MINLLPFRSGVEVYETCDYTNFIHAKILLPLFEFSPAMLGTSKWICGVFEQCFDFLFLKTSSGLFVERLDWVALLSHMNGLCLGGDVNPSGYDGVCCSGWLWMAFIWSFVFTGSPVRSRQMIPGRFFTRVNGTFLSVRKEDYTNRIYFQMKFDLMVEDGVVSTQDLEVASFMLRFWVASLRPLSSSCRCIFLGHDLIHALEMPKSKDGRGDHVATSGSSRRKAMVQVDEDTAPTGHKKPMS